MVANGGQCLSVFELAKTRRYAFLHGRHSQSETGHSLCPNGISGDRTQGVFGTPRGYQMRLTASQIIALIRKHELAAYRNR